MWLLNVEWSLLIDSYCSPYHYRFSLARHLYLFYKCIRILFLLCFTLLVCITVKCTNDHRSQDEQVCSLEFLLFPQGSNYLTSFSIFLLSTHSFLVPLPRAAASLLRPISFQCSTFTPSTKTRLRPFHPRFWSSEQIQLRNPLKLSLAPRPQIYFLSPSFAIILQFSLLLKWTVPGASLNACLCLHGKSLSGRHNLSSHCPPQSPLLLPLLSPPLPQQRLDFFTAGIKSELLLGCLGIWPNASTESKLPILQAK